MIFGFSPVQVALFLFYSVFVFSLGFVVGFYHLKSKLDQITAGVFDFEDQAIDVRDEMEEMFAEGIENDE